VTYFDDVAEFNRKFNLPHTGDGQPPQALSQEVLAYRFKFLLEELAEYALAHGAESLAVATRHLERRVEQLVHQMRPNWVDLPKALDALIDLSYVSIGTAHFHRFPFHQGWNEVQRANLDKEPGPTVHRNHPLDVRKPEGWRGPDHEEVLRLYRKVHGFDE
jgi:predicted HAD superfamily Cof-like phosphohydrolase